jgi:hypothetical protein
MINDSSILMLIYFLKYITIINFHFLINKDNV